MGGNCWETADEGETESIDFAVLKQRARLQNIIRLLTHN